MIKKKCLEEAALKICKVCGSSYKEKPRFCPTCGSYFIDVNDPTSEREWKGVIMGDGTIADNANTRSIVKAAGKSRRRTSYSSNSTSTRVWSILGLVFSSIVLRFNILAVLTELGISVLGFPFFIATVIALRRGDGVMKKIALFMFLGAILLFVVALFRGSRW